MRQILISTAICIGCATASYAQQSDNLLHTMKQELDYDMQQLKKQDLKPYYMSMRIEDRYQLNIASNFGTLNSSKEARVRRFTPQIRLGDKNLDNFKYTTQGTQTVQGMVVSQPALLPLDDNATNSIKAAMTKEVNNRYNYACTMYQQAKAKVATSVANEDKAPCFSDAPVEHYYEPAIPASAYNINKAAWEKKLNEVSAAFQSCPELKAGQASLEYEATRTYFINTDGTDVVQNRIMGRIILSASIVAEDGMQLPLNKDYMAYDIDSLPSTEKMIADVKDMIVRLVKLKNAPVADPYTGPAMLSGPASGVFFHEIFGHRLEGHRLKTGGETFKKMINQQVLPKEFQVYSDPTLRHYADTDLNGYYLYDSEGVKAHRVNNVVNGVLKSFLMSRVPLDGFPESNGHGRTSDSNDPVSRQSNLVVNTTKPYSDAQMRQMLRAEAKKQGKEYGYYFKTVTSGYTYTGEGGTLNSFNVTPLEVYRVFTDGRPDQLVRGVDLIGTPLSMFSHITAAGKEPSVFTGVCGAESGWVPVTAVSPTIFVTQIETQRRAKANETPAILSAPSFVKYPKNTTDSIIINAMRDELKRSMDSLQMAGMQRPFYLSYIANRFKNFNIKAELGGLVYSYDQPWDMKGNTQLMIGNFKRNSEIQVGQFLQTGIQAEPDYSSIRRSFWNVTDMAYKYNQNTYAQKMAYLNENPLPASIEKIPDMQRVAPITDIEDSKNFDFNQEKLNKMACELSAIFKDYKDLTNSYVTIEGIYDDTYRVTSENVILKQPHSYVKFETSAIVKANDGTRIQDGFTLYYTTPSELPSMEQLKSKVIAFAERFEALKETPEMDEDYKGPVLYTHDAAAIPFMQNLLDMDELYAKPLLQHNEKALGNKIGKKIIDPRITIKNYSDKAEYNGTKLMGNYRMDADGLKPASEMILVEKGVLKQILNRTTPAEFAPHSTASARFTNAPSAVTPMTSIGTMHIQAEGAIDNDKMEKELIKLGKKKKLTYVYQVNCPEGGMSLQLYRINVKTGEKQEVRSNSLTLPTLSNLESIAAISSQEEIGNQADKVNTSVIYPSSIILNDIELKKMTPRSEKAPAIPYPLQR